MPETPTVLTAVEAVQASPLAPITNPEVVKWVQQTLIDLGYPEVGEPDGKIGGMTRDTLLSFRRRENLPLVPTIDDELIRAIRVAAPRVLPVRQTEATEAHVAERVEAVKQVAEVERVGWWSKAWAVIAGVPSLILSLVLAAIDQFDEAMTALMPVKNTFDTIPIKYYIVGFVVMAALLGIQQVRITRLANAAKKELVTGYREGTVKNDMANGANNAAIP